MLLLTAGGADPNITDKTHASAIVYSIRNDDAEVCKYLIRHNSRPTVVDASEKSVLNYAIEQNATRCVRAFIDTVHPKLIDLRTVNQPPPLILSAVKGHPTYVLWLIEKSVEVNEVFEKEVGDFKVEGNALMYLTRAFGEHPIDRPSDDRIHLPSPSAIRASVSNKLWTR